jgi:hypothetical protein
MFGVLVQRLQDGEASEEKKQPRTRTRRSCASGHLHRPLLAKPDMIAGRDAVAAVIRL